MSWEYTKREALALAFAEQVAKRKDSVSIPNEWGTWLADKSFEFANRFLENSAKHPEDQESGPLAPRIGFAKNV